MKRFFRVFIAICLIVGGLSASSVSAFAQDDPGFSVKISSPWVNGKSVTGKTEPVSVKVTISGMTSGLSWAGSGSIMLWDVGRGLQFRPGVGEANLGLGQQTLTFSDTAVYDTPGSHPVEFTFTDVVSGRSVKARSNINVVTKVSRPRVSGVSGSLVKGKKRTVWGRADTGMAGFRVKVYFKPKGAKSYKSIGSASVRGNGVWAIKSAKIGKGKFYVKTAKFVLPTKSKKFIATSRSFKSKLPELDAISP